MDPTLNRFGLSKVKVIITALCCLLGLASIAFVYQSNGETFDYFYCLATIPFACLPLLMSILFKWSLHPGFYAIFSFYTIGPILGAVYSLYYVTWWWDDLLHALAGVLFAVCGAYGAIALNKKNQTSYLLSALFGLLFTMGIAVLWEFFEFSADLLLGSDMQADTVVTYLATKLGTTNGDRIIFDNIGEVLIDGQSLGIKGYLDIGLIDTIKDMAIETAGGVLYFIYALLDRDRHPLIVSVKNK